MKQNYVAVTLLLLQNTGPNRKPHAGSRTHWSCSVAVQPPELTEHMTYRFAGIGAILFTVSTANIPCPVLDLQLMGDH